MLLVVVVRVFCFIYLLMSRCTRVKVIRVEVSQNIVHARTTGWMTSTRPGKLRDFGLQPRRSNPRSRNLFWAHGVKSTWFLNFGGQAKCKLVLVVDSWPSLVVFGVVIPLWVKKYRWRHRRLSLSLSLSLWLSQKSLTHNIGSASALPIMNKSDKSCLFSFFEIEQSLITFFFLPVYIFYKHGQIANRS